MTSRDEMPTGTARLGPRPLPLHLAAAMAWLTSSSASRLSKNGLSPWKAALAGRVGRLERELGRVDAETLAAAVDSETRRRLLAFADGVLAYRRHGYRRRLIDPPVVWQEGTSRLLHFGVGAGTDAAPVLCVPSLVNRSYILDLSERRSLMRHLASSGLNPFLVDWGAPGKDEGEFGLDDYIQRRLEPILDRVGALAGRPPIVLGYCMGGVLALALAVRKPGRISALALLATPWDFAADLPLPHSYLEALTPSLEAVLTQLGYMPVDFLQSLFAAIDPMQVPRKFAAFAESGGGRLSTDGGDGFVALEDWLNDGTALSARVAWECLVGWYIDNEPGRGIWMIGNTPVRPERLKLPALVVVPAHDRIVTPQSARALARLIPGATMLEPPLGHIGMIVGGKAREAVWHPLVEWLRAVGRREIRPRATTPNRAAGASARVRRKTGKARTQKSHARRPG